VALESFYSAACFTLHHDNLGAILDFIPTAALPLVRDIDIVLDASQCYYWTGQAPRPRHPAWHLDQIVAANFPNGSPYRYDPTKPSHRDNFKTIMSTLASSGSTPIALHFNLVATYIFLDPSWYVEPDLLLEQQFRWTYELYRDIAVAVREAFASETSRRIVKSVDF